jgi:sigma-E factor negative regulatory protein RseC
MIEETGVVVALSGGLAEVETRRQGACGSCSANGACGTSLLARYLGRRPLLLRARNQAGAAPGDSVIVGVPEDGLVMASLAAYLVPLLGLMGGGALGQSLGGSLGAGAGGGILGALLGLGLGLGWLSRFNRGHAQDPRYQAVVLRRVGDPVTVFFPGFTPEFGQGWPVSQGRRERPLGGPPGPSP